MSGGVCWCRRCTGWGAAAVAHQLRLPPFLCRLTQWWHLVPGLPPAIPVAVGLVKGGDGCWVLVDAGTRDNPRQHHATLLLSALRAAIPPGERLAAIARKGQLGVSLGKTALRVRVMLLQRASPLPPTVLQHTTEPPTHPPTLSEQ